VTHHHPNRTKAARILVFCCACWAFSFPAMKALEQLGRIEAPGNSTFFFASLGVAIRFGVAALLLAIVILPRLSALTRLELHQGVGLGILGAIGLVLQMDAMAYTRASTCAFLTQGYCVWLPIWFSLRHRRPPPLLVLVSSVMVLLGGAILAGVSWGQLRLGRGEWETLAGSIVFAAQILWLERPVYRGNDVYRFSAVMFATIAALCLPVAALSAQSPLDLAVAFRSPAAITLLGVLIVLCTLITFLLANRWQPEVPATEAGLLYATEPVFTAAVSLVVPGWITQFAGIHYPNERLTANLLVGGGMILAAIILLQLLAQPAARFDPAKNLNPVAPGRTDPPIETGLDGIPWGEPVTRPGTQAQNTPGPKTPDPR
jgi:drug/metabolite transporter (DMT)-like permease